MISYKKIRLWHKWPGILFLFPAFVVSITCILLALDPILNMNKVTVGFLPEQITSTRTEIKATVITPTHTFLGTKHGLLVMHEGLVTEVDGLAGYDIRGLFWYKEMLFVASKQGIWRVTDGRASKLSDREAFGITAFGDELLFISLGQQGYLITDLEGNPMPDQQFIDLAEIHIAQPITLKRWIVDLHTGRGIVGKKLEPYWIALCGLQMLIITITGLWLILKKSGKKKKRDQMVTVNS